MQSLNRIIKNKHISFANENLSIIETKIIGKHREPENIKNHEDENPAKIEPTQDEIQRDILLRTEEERLHIIRTAKEQAEAMFVEFKKKGYNEGLESGYKEGLDNAKAEGMTIKGNALELLKQAEENATEYFKANEANIIRLSAQMAEAIIHHKINTSDEDILMLINPILEKFGGDGNITITCHPDKTSPMKKKVEELKTVWEDTGFTVLTDSNLEMNGCTVENGYQFIDLQIKKQLESILKEINNLE